MAVKISIGVEDIEERKVYNLAQLRKNSRKRVNKKAGTKKPRPCDKDENILAAPDSIKEVQEMTSTPISTPIGENNANGSISKRKRDDCDEGKLMAKKRIKFEGIEENIELEESIHIISHANEEDTDDMQGEEMKWIEFGKFSLTRQHKMDITKDKTLRH
jgi:hypothetical protein